MDDGYTGTNFNRPGFQEMIEDIEAGYVTTVIVKDMSRLGRNYLQVGYYWAKKGIRKGGKKTQDNPCKWCKTTITKILTL